MGFYNTLSRQFFYPLADIITGWSVSKTLSFLEISQWWDTQQLKDYQNKKLRALVNHAYRNVPYYHRIFRENELHPDDVREIGDLKKLPILTKKIIRENFPENIVAKNIPRKDHLKGNTSGSSGEQLIYYNTRLYRSFMWASAYRAWGWAGYKLGDK